MKNILLLNKMFSTDILSILKRSYEAIPTEGNSSLKDELLKVINSVTSCDDCRVAVLTENYSKHCGLKSHTNKNAPKTPASKTWCDSCNKNYLTKNFEKHLESQGHKNKLNPKEVVKKHCDECNKDFLEKKFEGHLKTKTHEKNVAKKNSQTPVKLPRTRSKTYTVIQPGGYDSALVLSFASDVVNVDKLIDMYKEISLSVSAGVQKPLVDYILQYKFSDGSFTLPRKEDFEKGVGGFHKCPDFSKIFDGKIKQTEKK